MSAAPASDFFGASYLGYDPYHEAASNWLDRMGQLDTLVRGQYGAPASGASRPTMAGGDPRPQGSTMAGIDPRMPINPAMSAAANYAVGRGGSMYAPMYAPMDRSGGGEPGGPGGGGPGGGGSPGRPNPPEPGPGGPNSPCGPEPRTECTAPGGWYCDGQFWQCGQSNPTPPPRSNPTPGTPSGPGPTPAYGGVFGRWGPGDTGSLPPDLASIRAGVSSLLQSSLQRNGGNPTEYGGNLELPSSGLAVPGQQQAWNYANSLPSQMLSIMGPGRDALQGLLTYDNQIDPGFLRGYAGGATTGADIARIGAQYIGQGNPYAMDIAANGGLPDLTSGLNAIQARAKLAIEQNNAALREKFGAMGLSSGSDVNEALARGSSTGYAQMAADQSQYLTNAILQAQTNRLGGISALNQSGAAAAPLAQAVSGAYGTAGSLENGVQGLLLQNIATLGNLRLGAANTLGSYAGTYGSNLNAATQNLLALSGMDTSAQAQTIQNQYGNFNRMQGPNPWMNAALGYATNYPPPQATGPSTGAMLGSAALTAAGSSAQWWGPILASAIASDRNLKEDIKPLKGSVLGRLKKLPISTWRYKGDAVRHIGPMAQDFAKSFGIGDGKNIHLVDFMGVVLQSMKELGKRTEVNYGTV